MSAEELATSPTPAAPRPERAAGRYLTLLGITPDGRRLRLADLSGNEFTVDIDARLRAALGVTPPVAGRDTPAQVETTMDSMLRPRDIQARIRAGETPESVAAAAGTPVERVMPFAAPVLAEREHIADRAQKSSIRRPAGTAVEGGARTLGDAVTGHLHGRNVDPDVVTWDAWRREDGRWALAGRYSVQGRDGLAELTYDAPGNFVVLDNDDARWLVGDLPDAPAAEPEPEAAAPGVRRLSAVPDEDQLALGDDVLGLVDVERPVEAYLDAPPAEAPEPRAGVPAEEPADEPLVEVEEVLVVEETLEVSVEARETAETPETAPEANEPPRRPIKKTRGRASVPSWDEIMFGGGPTEG